jgi:type IV pilus assembly protein PilA
MTALKKGFTLIELLIVIAILGVLAVVVLVAINPVQQLARTRDAGRISTVSQLGHSVEAYYTSHNGTYPATGLGGITTLVSTGEITQVPAEVNNTLTTNATLGGCAAGSAYAAYLSLAGRGCVVCGSTTVGANTDDTACVN